MLKYQIVVLFEFLQIPGVSVGTLRQKIRGQNIVPDTLADDKDFGSNLYKVYNLLETAAPVLQIVNYNLERFVISFYRKKCLD